MSALSQHPLSAAFPAMSERERHELAADIEKHGLRHPVVMWQGQVLDGWHRYQACLESDREPTFVEFDGVDPVAFVLSQNLHRRQLTGSQRAAAVVECNAWRKLGENQHSEGRNPVPTLTEAEMAKAAGTSDRTIRHAKKAKEAGLDKPVIEGRVSAKTAASVADLPAKERKKVEKLDPADWVDELARKSPPKEEALEEVADNAAQLADDAERIADLVLELEDARRILEADDKLAEARLIIKEQRAKYEQLEKLYDAQRRELAEMTKEAKRWKRKAEAKEAA